jgi:Protein of unknown function (DUF1688)
VALAERPVRGDVGAKEPSPGRSQDGSRPLGGQERSDVGAPSNNSLARALRQLRTPETIRERCRAITAAVTEGRSQHFTIQRSRLPEVAERVAALARKRFPDLKIPYHSRWRHFEAGGVDRKAELDERLVNHTTTAVARARIDLTLVSVLLDAGAGAAWSYQEAESGQRFARSEGLGVASFRAFMAGCFSSQPGDPCRVDADALRRINAASLAAAFQVHAGNSLVGLEGRVVLLQRLGAALRAQPGLFTTEGQPGRMFDVLTHHKAPHLQRHHPVPAPQRHHVDTARLLGLLLDAFSAIWPSGQLLQGEPIGDVWPHEFAGGDGLTEGLVPFHKLSQWLAYSLLEPFEWAGVQVTGLERLTGLPEYRNGGLLLDAGVLCPRDAGFAERRYTPADTWVIEWRALTVALLDELAPLVRETLGVSAEQLPLACILEAGTWAAGRQLAAELRPDGAPPVQIDSDGTVF